jgi:putative DNA-invertase from lambdoid prophage Rac
MSRVFCYCRVSTGDQTTENQILEIQAAGFSVANNRIVEETISGDVLVVTRLDRLGRSVIDVRQTVDALAARDIRVHCLALGGVDLTSSAGRMTMSVLAAVAEFERDLLVERTQAGLMRARAEGKQPGRPPRLTPEQRAEVRSRLAHGAPVAYLAREYGVARRIIHRARDAHP